MRELALHILDVVENALEAGASRVEVGIDEDMEADRMTISIRDNGRGMPADVVPRVLDPFFTTRTTRHVGLGLPLLAAAAQRCEGDLRVESWPGAGTSVTASFRHGHLDRAPLGNVAGTLLAVLLRGDGTGPELAYRHRLDGRTFELDTAAMQIELGGIPWSYRPLRQWLHDYIIEGEAALAVAPEGGNDAKA